ncbi:hypothetical protein ASF61_01690 [Duganella sp. Leaf126]|uniref:hypothetical protein n=1 Tax=Duganella sp. Leaf126 TaxID=1736266 RepID=UPI0006F1FA7B|nr:hypothetical protein [Duganella sp. Leaf126]KQQ47388.1 hypothetical protein ASF61_01690 [Duganella sp. Leaf126]
MALFTKTRFVLNPIDNPRTWVTFGVALACLLAVGLLPRGFDLVGILRIAMLGVAGYIGAAALEHLPVRGTVAAADTTALLARIAMFGYLPAGESAQGQVYTHRSASPMRHIFSPIVVGRAVGGRFTATVPLRFYRAVKNLDA